MSDEAREKIDAGAVCELCGHVKGTAKQLNDEVKQEYMASILGERNFTHTYCLMNGNIILTFEAPKGDILQTQDRILNTISDYKNATERNKLFDQVLVLFTLKELCVQHKDIRKVLLKQTLNDLAGITVADIDKAYTKLTENLDQGMLINIRLCARMFNDLQISLALNGLDTNFWRGVGQH